MRFLIFLSLFGIILLGCEQNDSLSSSDRYVISEDGTTSFRELLILFNLKASDSSYLVVESVDSVNIFVNDNFWARVCSQTIDTSVVNKFINENQYQSLDKINYLVIAPQFNQIPELNTAGEYSLYLNSVFELDPGEYACFIESFQLTFNDNTIRKYYPLLYKTFRVDENTRSAFVGEIELKIY
jgi:hypothetical protein